MVPDALHLFTPDVMARLIDRVRGCDVEIIDEWLFLVSSRDVVTLDPDAWQALYDAVGALGLIAFALLMVGGVISVFH